MKRIEQLKSNEISPEKGEKKEEERFLLPDLEEARKREDPYPWVKSAEEAQRSLIEQIKEAEENLKQLLEGVKEGTNLHKRLKELAYDYSETRSKKGESGTPEGDFEAAIRDFENWYKAKLELLLNEKWRRLEILSSEEKGGKDKELNEKAYLIAKEKGFSVDPIKCNDDAREFLLGKLGEEITDEEVRESMKKEEEIEKEVAKRMAEERKEEKVKEVKVEVEEGGEKVEGVGEVEEVEKLREEIKKLQEKIKKEGMVKEQIEQLQEQTKTPPSEQKPGIEEQLKEQERESLKSLSRRLISFLKKPISFLKNSISSLIKRFTFRKK